MKITFSNPKSESHIFRGDLLSMLVATVIAACLFPTYSRANVLDPQKWPGLVGGLAKQLTEKPPVVPAIPLKNGKFIYILALIHEGESQCTWDFDALKAKGEGWYKCYIDSSVPPRLLIQMRFGRKGDKIIKGGIHHSTDRNIKPNGSRGQTFGNGDEIYLEGGRNFLAERGLDARRLLEIDRNSAVIFYPREMTLEDALKNVGNP